jgi:hypothetical protein
MVTFLNQHVPTWETGRPAHRSRTKDVATKLTVFPRNNKLRDPSHLTSKQKILGKVV